MMKLTVYNIWEFEMLSI